MIKKINETLSRVQKIYDLQLEVNGKNMDIEVIINSSDVYDNDTDYNYLNKEEKDRLTDEESDEVDEFISNNY